MNNNKDMLDKLNVVEREIKELRECLQKPVAGGKGWVPEIGERYYCAGIIFVQSDFKWDNTKGEREMFAAGRVFSFTPEGKAAAERFVFLEGFRARWRQSADRLPSEPRWCPLVKVSEVVPQFVTHPDGVLGWSTAVACRAFVDSEGGPEKFKEILEGGIL